MYGEGQHHPKWFFVAGWNSRPCRCDKCDMAKMMIYPTPKYTQPQPTPYLPYEPLTTWGGTAAPNHITSGSTTNVK